MALDPRIILGGETPRIKSPAEAQLERFKLRQVATQDQLDQIQLAKAKQTAPQTQSDEQLLQEVMQEAGNDPAKVGYALLTRGKFKQAMDFIEGWDKHVKALQEPKTPAPKLAQIQTVDEQGTPVTKFVEETAGASYPTVPKAQTETLPAAAKEYEYAKTQGYKGTFEQYQNEDANRHKSTVSVSVPGATASDPKDIAAAIVSGEQPPTGQGLYRAWGAVRAELARKGYDLTTAQTDWTAAQRHFTTLNGAQQTRMRQAVDNAAHSLDVIDDLATQWRGGKFPVLNRVQLGAAKQGVLGPKAQQIATQLEAQIADVTSELGNVYMGGNSPTDHALGLAAKNLSADWTESQLKSAIALARKNLTIRQNSIRNTGAIGASEQNPYAPPPTAAPVTAPAATGGTPSYQDYLRAKGKLK